MTDPSLTVWSTIWSQVVELDSLAYHLGVPMLFMILGLIAMGVGVSWFAPSTILTARKLPSRHRKAKGMSQQ
jgi:hypothetical protein